jgi:hypothetical protein
MSSQNLWHGYGYLQNTSLPVSASAENTAHEVQFAMLSPAIGGTKRLVFQSKSEIPFRLPPNREEDGGQAWKRFE